MQQILTFVVKSIKFYHLKRPSHLSIWINGVRSDQSSLEKN